MGGFLLVNHPREEKQPARRVYAAGLAAQRALQNGAPAEERESDLASAAVFSRDYGSAPHIAYNPASQNWLVAAGTWFHSNGFAGGSEQQLLEAYEHHGIDALANSLEGFFVIAVHEAATGETTIITDIAGSCHAFVRPCGPALLIGSSSLVAAAVAPLQPDSVAWQEFLYTGNIYEDRTLWREVRKLPPASIIRIRGGRIVEQRRYWRVAELDSQQYSGARAVEHYWQALTQAAAVIARHNANPVCDLTGGFDSRVLAAGLLAANAPFTASVSGEPNDADVPISRGLAQKAGLPHLHFRPDWSLPWHEIRATITLTDGECNAFEYAHVMNVHRQLAPKFSISLNGSFGELARGAWWDLLQSPLGKAAPVSAALIAQSRFVPPLRPALFQPDHEIDLLQHFTEVVERTNADVMNLPNTAQVDNAYLYIRMQRWQGRIATSTSRIWPCLSPFLLRSVMEAVLSTDWRTRRSDGLFRNVLARFSPALGAYPLDRGTPAVPMTFTNFYRFLGAGTYYWHRFKNRWQRRHGATTGPETTQRLAMWSDAEIASLLTPTRMQTNALLDEARLGAFLQASRSANFPYGRVWGRLVTLEAAYASLLGAESSARDAAGLHTSAPGW